jgi:hypothetical protein
MWKNMVLPDRPQMATWRMRIAHWMIKATDTLSECIKLIAFPLQQWLRERALMLRYTYIASFVFHSAVFMFMSTNGIFVLPVPQSIPVVQFTNRPTKPNKTNTHQILQHNHVPSFLCFP